VASLLWKVGLHGRPQSWSLPTAWHHLSQAIRVRGVLVVQSLGSAALAGAVTAAVALVVCWLLSESPRWFHSLVLVLMAAAWALPAPVIGLGLNGIIILLIDWTNLPILNVLLYRGPSPLPLWWAYLIRFFPFAVALLWPVVRLLPSEMRDAARTEGARPHQELLYIVWPLTMFAALRAGGAVMVLALGELGASKLAETPGSQTFAHEVFNQMHYGVTADLAALCLVLLGVVGLGGFLVAGCGALAQSRHWR
jgi:ABC-type Fe3+ transport system permease subunit